jgi:CTP synthase
MGLGGGSKKRGGQDTKYIIVTGGVLSGIGKGVTASSLGVLLKMMGLRATAIKIDPYLNVDAGTMSPFEHGEVFVLDDGGETDLDLGNYERFLGVSLRNESNLTTGKIYQQVIEKERRGDYLGKTVQVVPHITDAIQEWIIDVSHKSVDSSGERPDVCIIELGGTLGDIESMPFVEALRQLQVRSCLQGRCGWSFTSSLTTRAHLPFFQDRVGYKNCCFVHVSLVPTIGSSCEQKTKPTQHSVKQMRALGLAPDFIMCRGTHRLEDASRDKLAMFCQVPPARVLSVHDVSNIYRVPLLLIGECLAAGMQAPALHSLSHITPSLMLRSRLHFSLSLSFDYRAAHAGSAEPEVAA